MKNGGRAAPAYARQQMAKIIRTLNGEGVRVLKAVHVGYEDGFEHVLVESEITPEDFE